MVYICNQTIDKILARFDKQKTAHKIDKAKERKFQVENLPKYFWTTENVRANIGKYLTEIKTKYIICYRWVRLWCRRSTATRALLTTLPTSSLWKWTNWKGSSGWREQGRIFMAASLWFKWTTFGTVNPPIQANPGHPLIVGVLVDLCRIWG